MQKRKRNQAKHILLLLCIITSFSSPICASAISQDDLKSKIDEIIQSEKYNELNLFGPRAIPYVLEALQSSRDFTGREFSLFWFISHTEGEQSDHALVELLHHPSAHLRGWAATHIGSRRIKEAVPELVALLQDSSVWANLLCEEYGESKATDQNKQGSQRVARRRGNAQLVKDEAVKALEEITGLEISNSESFDKRARAWRRWWRKQKAEESEWLRR